MLLLHVYGKTVRWRDRESHAQEGTNSKKQEKREEHVCCNKERNGETCYHGSRETRMIGDGISGIVKKNHRKIG